MDSMYAFGEVGETQDSFSTVVAGLVRSHWPAPGSPAPRSSAATATAC